MELTTCRQIGMGLGPIPFTAIIEYAKIYDDEEWDDLIFLIREMDTEYLKAQNDGRKHKNNSDKRSSKRK